MPFSTTTQFDAIDSLVEAVIAVNEQGIVEFANRAMVDLFGYSKVQLIGQQMSMLLPDGFAERHSQLRQDFFKQASSRRMAEGRFLQGKHKNGQLIPIEVSLTPFESKQQKLVLALIVDASKKIQLIREAETLKAFYKSVVDYNQDYIAQVDSNLTIQYVNHIAPNLKKQDVVGSHLLSILPDSEKERVAQKLEEVFESKEPVQYSIEYPSLNGKSVFETAATPIVKNNVVVGVNLISKDVTALRDLEQRNREQHDFISNVMNSSANAVYIYDLEKRRYTYVNRQFTELSGYTLEELQAMAPEQYSELFHPEDLQGLAEHLERIKALNDGEYDTMLYRIKNKSGSIVWCQARDCGFDYDSEGNLTSILGSFVDVSELKLANEQLLVQSVEMEQFVYMATHDLKSPLSSVQQVIDSLLDPNSGLSEDSKQQLLERSGQTVSRLLNMIVSLLDFAKKDMSEPPKRVDLNILIPDVLRDLTADINRSHALVKFAGLPVILGFMPHLQMLFQNLIQNAIKYRSHERSPVINISCKEQLDHYLFSISDNGQGIAEKHQKSIFNIFTKAHSESEQPGSGIGLANCKRVVTMHKGNIWVESEQENGSTFYFTIAKQL